RDRFRDVALLGADSRISAGGVDEGDDGQAKFICHAHQTKRFAVSLRVSRTKVAPDVFLGVAPFLSANGHDLVVTQPRKPAHHRAILSEKTVTVQLAKIAEGSIQIIHGKRPSRMPGQLDS